MKKDNKNKKILKIIIIIVTLAMVVSTFASFIPPRKSGNTKVMDSDNKVQDNAGIKANTEITAVLKKDMENAKVQVKDKEVLGTINVSEAANKVQADKIADAYTSTLKEKYKNKDIKVQVIYNKQKLSESNTFININKDSDDKLPKINAQISSGLTNMDRYVSVTLETDRPEQFKVVASGQELKYVSSKKIFHGIVESTDEDGIKKSIKVSLKK